MGLPDSLREPQKLDLRRLTLRGARMADQGEHLRSWFEAVSLPLVAAAANYALETAFPSIESPLFPFLALVFVTLRHPNRFAWICFAVTLAATLVEGVRPGATPGPIPDGWNRPDLHDKLVAEGERLLPLVAKSGIPQMLVFSGNRRLSDTALKGKP